MEKKQKRVSPVSLSERIGSLDVLRGFAVLGILIMNIQGYAMIGAAYLNPAAFGDLNGLNRVAWIVSHILGDQKFMTIFSILFGAGIVLFSGRAEAAKRKPAALHYRRTFWLLVIGLMHSYLLWNGDILVAYALCALIVYLFRKLTPKKLLIIGLVLLAISSLIYLMAGLSMPSWPEEAVAATMEFWQPGAEAINQEIAAYRGGFSTQMLHRAPSSFYFQTFIFLIWTGWRAGGLMLLGMAFFKWRILSAERSNHFYRSLALIGFAVGLPIVSAGVVYNFSKGWTLQQSMFLGWQFNYWGSLLVSLAFIAVVMLICKNKVLNRLTSAFSAVGRMAFSNYLLQTVICTFIFYGHGLGLFAKVDRIYQILIVAAVWIFQLIVSPIWLRHFRFGPAEWLWRSLTYWKIQPLRIRE